MKRITSISKNKVNYINNLYDDLLLIIYNFLDSPSKITFSLSSKQFLRIHIDNIKNGYHEDNNNNNNELKKKEFMALTVKHGYKKLFDWGITMNCHIYNDKNSLCILSVIYKQFRILKYLIKILNYPLDNLILTACQCNQLKILKWLYKKDCKTWLNPTFDHFCAQASIKYGHIRILKYLITIKPYYIKECIVDLIDYCVFFERRNMYALLSYFSTNYEDSIFKSNEWLIKFKRETKKMFK